MTDALNERAATLTPDELAAAEAVGFGPELTPEEEFERARAEEQEWVMAADGTLSTVERDPVRRGAAWSPGTRGRAVRW